MTESSLQDWLQRLEVLHPKPIDLGLERVAEVGEKLGLLEPCADVITVAGTNGKGSTVAVMEAVLSQMGCSTGAFTSPHLLRYNERIRVDGRPVDDRSIVEAFAAIDRVREDISLTYFEFATLAALFIFADRGCEILLLEVGLGGRFDAVNAVDAKLSIITSIDLDHQHWLGTTRAAIGVEKLGIARACRPLLIADPAPPVELLQRAVEMGAMPILQIGREFLVDVDRTQLDCELRDGDNTRHLKDLGIGPLEPANVAVALQALLLLGYQFSDQQLTLALGNLSVPCRRQTLKWQGNEYLLDVAHNPAAVKKLVQYISSNPCKGRTIALFSAMADKDIHAMIEAATGVFDAWFIAAQPELERAAPTKEITAHLGALGETVVIEGEDLEATLSHINEYLAPDDKLVVFGSFYTVAAVLPLFHPGSTPGITRS